jgi:hypothetical protein
VSVWDDFFVAQVGASAALAGLLFVGISINMNRILQFPVLPNRALQALTLLITILMVASVLLIPGAGTVALGLIVLAAAAVSGGMLTTLARRVLAHTDPRWRRPHLGETALIEGALALYAASGVVFLLVGWEGAYLLVPAFLISYVVAIMISWVLLVEINR